MTDRYALFGNPLGHSKSPRIHDAFAAQTGEDVHYELIEALLGGFRATVDAFRAAGGRGGNVTLPFKLDAFEYATDRMERARLAGAVNCMKFEGDRALAENFDGVGLVNDVQRNLGFAMRGKRVLLMGAGGAARGAMLPFLETKPALLVVANRTVPKAIRLGEQFGAYGTLAAGGYADIGSQAFDVVVNATSASLRGELPPVPPTAFAPGCLAYDLVYGKGLTPFLRVARDAGAARLADGVGMLVEQAAEAWVWWRGVRPATRPMIEAISVPLE
jgi:shikimate dehydrogenase